MNAGSVLIALSVGTLSGVLFASVFVWPEGIGTHYSNRRFLTLYANIALAVGIMIVAARHRGQMSLSLLLQGGGLAVGWLYLAAVSAVV
jgi:hypothetical protein